MIVGEIAEKAIKGFAAGILFGGEIEHGSRLTESHENGEGIEQRVAAETERPYQDRRSQQRQKPRVLRQRRQ